MCVINIEKNEILAIVGNQDVGIYIATTMLGLQQK